MAHHHDHHNHPQDGAQNIATAFFLNVFFVVIEVVGGLYTNSIAILSDAVHDFGDCISLGITWGLHKKSQQARDEYYSYGYKRFALLGNIFLGILLLLSSFFIIREAILRLIHPEPVHAQGMLWIAIVGILINGAAAFRMSRHVSITQRAVYIHLMEDVLGWVAVFISSLVLHFWNIPILDSLLSIVITIWVLYHILGNLRKTFKILLQSVPDELNIVDLKKEILGINGVMALHDLHFWSQDGESHVLTLHLVIDSMEIGNRIRIKEALYKLTQAHHIEHVTVDLEIEGEECLFSCD